MGSFWARKRGVHAMKTPGEPGIVQLCEGLRLFGAVQFSVNH
ncbi:MAG: hypothetical protein BMS9Abin28_0935 [Anaerolineae bacterium]|nr:MAG: hypothetical protein BMS9Abin28_0935 [Anaerolineae bacterium]